MKNLLTYLIISLSILQNLAGQATYNFKHISSQNGFPTILYWIWQLTNKDVFGLQRKRG